MMTYQAELDSYLRVEPPVLLKVLMFYEVVCLGHYVSFPRQFC